MRYVFAAVVLLVLALIADDLAGRAGDGERREAAVAAVGFRDGSAGVLVRLDGRNEWCSVDAETAAKLRPSDEITVRIKRTPLLGRIVGRRVEVP